MTVTREEGTALFSRTGQEDRYMPLPSGRSATNWPRSCAGWTPDQIYGEALGAMAGVADLDLRPAAAGARLEGPGAGRPGRRRGRGRWPSRPGDA